MASHSRVGASVRTVEELAELEPLVPAWQDLASAAVEPNVYYEPWMILPAVRHLAEGERLRFAFVFRPDPSGRNTPLMIGMFPLHQTRRYYRIPVRTMHLWRHKHCFLCVPLLHRDYAAEAVNSFLCWFRENHFGCSLLNFAQVAGDGPFPILLHNWLLREGTAWSMPSEYPRAVFACNGNASVRPRVAISGGHLRDLRRRQRRLNDIAPTRFEISDTGADVEKWMDSFLALEAAGWKGKENTALSCNPREEAFFREITREGYQRGQALLMGLYLGDRPLALAVCFTSQDVAFAFKIAYDEGYSQFSPGTLLILEHNRLLSDGNLRQIDSCTEFDHSIASRVSEARRLIRDVVISNGSLRGNIGSLSVPLLRWWCKRISRGRSSAAGSPTV